MYIPTLQNIFEPFTGDLTTEIYRYVLPDFQIDRILFDLDTNYGEHLRDFPVKIIGIDVESAIAGNNFQVVFKYGGKFYKSPNSLDFKSSWLDEEYTKNRLRRDIPNFPVALYHHLMGLTDEDRVIYRHHYQTSNLSVIITNTFHGDNYLKQMRIGKYLILDHDKESVVFHSYDCLIGTTHSFEEYDKIVKIRESMLAVLNT